MCRFEAVEKFEDALTGVRVIEFEENCIRLSLKTYIPNFESIISQQKIEGAIDPLELNHELIVETVDGTLEPKNVEVRLLLKFCEMEEVLTYYWLSLYRLSEIGSLLHRTYLKLLEHDLIKNIKIPLNLIILKY